MGLLTITNLEDGQDAVANALNERFGKIVDVINGNIESQNLKNNAVTREKIAPQSVTSDKLSINKYIDENGWTVTDYGTTKSYRYEKKGNITINGMSGFEMFRIPLPVGVSNIDDMYVNWSAIQHSQEVVYTIWPDPNDKEHIVVRAWNTINVKINNHPYVLSYVLEPKG